MEFVRKISLRGTLDAMRVGASIFISDRLFKETTIRVCCSKTRKETGRQYKVMCKDGGCDVKRLS